METELAGTVAEAAAGVDLTDRSAATSEWTATTSATASTSPGARVVPPEVCAEVEAIYDRGLYLQALRRAERFAPLKDWRGTQGRVLAGRLAGNLGGGRMAAAHHYLAWRGEPSHTQARYFYARRLQERFGPARAWRFVSPLNEAAFAAGRPQPEPDDGWEMAAFRAHVLGQLRDFERAERWMAKAEAASPNPPEPWLWVEKADLLEEQDRYEEALSFARRALEVRPFYRPGVQAAAHLLQLLGRDREALELLTEAMARLESGAVAMHLAMVQSELGHHADLVATLERCRGLTPLAEKGFDDWMAAHLCDAEYRRGNLSAAAAHAGRLKDPYHTKLAERLSAPDAASASKRVLLPVGFVRQHHVTCAPATLAALSRYWSRPAEHLEIAEKICFNGTSAHSERVWATGNGFAVREFTVTWESAVALLDRGVPFTLTTKAPVEAAPGHLQAAIGYDALKRSLLIRDPYMRHYGEWGADETLERQKAHGPRGLAMVPADRADLLDGIALPDADLYDRMFELEAALERHDRPAAAAVRDAMEAAAPGHRLAVEAARVLAIYDTDRAAQLAAVERLLERYPADGLLALMRLSYLNSLDRPARREELLAGLASAKDADPVFLRLHAEVLARDPARRAAGRDLLDRAVSMRPRDPNSLRAAAELAWEDGRRGESLELHRLAACLADKDENLALGYFRAARSAGRAAEALAYLKRRVTEAGAKSSAPALTLVAALSDMDRADEGFAVLVAALAARPADGDLLLSAAAEHARYGRFDRAAGLLESARGKASETARVRAEAELAELSGDPARALPLWRRVAEASPLDLDAHRAVARLAEGAEGRAAALAHLRAVAGRFPHCRPIQSILIEWLREDPAELEPVARRMVESAPSDAWFRRELAFALGEMRRLPEAFAEAETALRTEPTNPAGLNTRGRLHEIAGDLPAARTDFREAVRMAADNDYAIHRLIGACASIDERREELRFVLGELRRQTTLGDGLIAWRTQAVGTLEPGEILSALREANAARPDLWQTWSVLVRQLLDGEPGPAAEAEALEVAARQAERFPLLPPAWLELAGVHRRRGDREGERAALARALEIRPGWGTAARRLAEVHERAGDFEAARALLESSAARNPLDAAAHGALAGALWKLGRREEAVERLRHALRLEPGYEWAWGTLSDWGRQLGRPWECLAAARDLAERRPGEARSWLMLARAVADAGESAADCPVAASEPSAASSSSADREDGTGPAWARECLSALDRAAALNPRMEDAHDLRAVVLCGLDRFDEAAAACRPAVYGDKVPHVLRGRAAWVERRRGRAEEAVGLMRAVLDEEPAYVWGRTVLADWLRESGPAEEYRKAAEALVRLCPDDAEALVKLGEARIRCGDRAGGKADLRRALDRQPDCVPAAASLLAETLADGELDDAAALAGRVRTHIGAAEADSFEVRIAAKRGDGTAAAAALRRLLVPADGASAEAASPHRPYWPIGTALDAVLDAGWWSSVSGIVRAAAEAEPRGDAPRACRAGAETPAFKAMTQAWLRIRDDGCGIAEGPARDAELSRLAGELVELFPGHPLSWGYRAETALAAGVSAGGDRAEADLKRALELDPGYEWAARTLFEVRLRSDRLDDAEAALAAMRGKAPEATVRSSEVRLAARKGDRPRAVAALEPLAAEAADETGPLVSAAEAFVGAGWAEDLERTLLSVADRPDADAASGARPRIAVAAGLAELSDALGEGAPDARRLKLARAMVRVAPKLAQSHGYLGDACSRAGRRIEALTAFREAVALDPKYRFGVESLLAAQLAEGDWNGAEAAAAVLEEHHGREAALRARTEIEAARGRLTAALDRLGDLCRVEGVSAWAVRSAVACLGRAGWDGRAGDELARIVAAPGAAPAVAEVWVEQMVGAGRAGETSSRIGRLLAERQTVDIARRAAAAYIEALAESGETLRIRWFLWWNGEAIRPDAAAWGRIGAALHAAGMFGAVASWMSDWSARRDAEPWMLMNLVTALRRRGETGKAAEVGLRALTLDADHATAPHALLLAADAAAEGRARAARELLAAAASAPPPPQRPAFRRSRTPDPASAEYRECLSEMVEAVLTVLEAPPEARAGAVAAGRHALDAAAAGLIRMPPAPELRALLRRLAWRMAAGAGLSARFWALGKWLS